MSHNATRNHSADRLLVDSSMFDVINQSSCPDKSLGLDPLDMKKAEATKPAIPTVEIAARQVHQQLLPGWHNPKHGKQWLSTREQYAFPVIGQQPIYSITPAQIARVLQPIWLTIPETAP